jgi:hypothetical protein
VVLTRDEVRAVLDRLSGEKLLMASLMHGSGLRLTECLRLRVQDLDFARGELMVRDGKGGKDRVTVLSAASAAVYGAAAVLFLLGGRWPRAWLVLLLCGIALVLGFLLSLIWSSAVAGVGYLDRIFLLFDSALLLALYLTVLSAIELRRRDGSQYAQLTD